MPARLLSAFMGAWLFASAFCWPHGPGARALSWIAGLAILAIALAAMVVPRVRLLNAVVALLLLVGTFLLRQDPGTLWNNITVGLTVFFAATVPPLQPAQPARA